MILYKYALRKIKTRGSHVPMAGTFGLVRDRVSLPHPTKEVSRIAWLREFRSRSSVPLQES